MGNANSPAPNQVDIFQSGGCSGGGNYGFAAPQFDSTTMDPRLAPYLTEKEYSEVVFNANNVLKKRAPTSKILLWAIPLMAISIIRLLFAALFGPSYSCHAANGICLEGQDPAKDSCCLVTCCRNSDRRLQDNLKDLDNLKEVSKHRLQEKDLEGNYWNATSAIANNDSVQIDVPHAKRALLSPRKRRSLQLRSACEQWTEGDRDYIPGECMCRQTGKHRVCDGSVSVEGQHEKDEGLRWMLPIAIFFHMGSFLLPFAYTLYFACALTGYINAALEPWTRKGLQCHYQRAGKHLQARISVFTPQTYVVGRAIAWGAA